MMSPAKEKTVSEADTSRENPLLRTARTRPVFGTFVIEFFSPGLPTLLKQAGADWVLLDLEHSGLGVDSARAPIAVGRQAGITTVVRVPGPHQHLVSTALDAGADAIMVPWVESAEEAERIASWTKYPPVGVRGSAFGIAGDQYVGGPAEVAQRAADARTFFLPQIETPGALDDVSAIAALPGVDVPFVGPLDLSTNLGVSGNFTAPVLERALERVLEACAAHGKVPGIFAPTVELARRWSDMGFRMVSLAADTALLRWAFADGLEALRRGSASEGAVSEGPASEA